MDGCWGGEEGGGWWCHTFVTYLRGQTKFDEKEAMGSLKFW